MSEMYTNNHNNMLKRQFLHSKEYCSSSVKRNPIKNFSSFNNKEPNLNAVIHLVNTGDKWIILFEFRHFHCTLNFENHNSAVVVSVRVLCLVKLMVTFSYAIVYNVSSARVRNFIPT
jgi:hypothetical protein